MVFQPDRILKGKIFDSKIKSQDVERKEQLLGYLLGPAFVLSMFYIAGQSYLNTFYTDVLNLTPVWGGLFLAILPIVSKILDAFTNILMGWIVDRTKSRHGKARPWLLLSAPLLALCGVLLFSVPKAGIAVQIAWVTISYNLYFSIAFTMYNISHNLMVPLSTRNSKQRDALSIFSSVGVSMIPGALVAFVMPSLILPYIGIDQSKWMLVMSVLSILALPAVMLEYYFTRERVTEEGYEEKENTPETVDTKEQFRGCFKSKYWILIMLILIIYNLYNNFQVTSMIYYANWVLGSYNDGITLTLLNVGGQFPLGVGVIFLWPIVKKFGKRNTMAAGFVVGIMGCLIGLINVHSIAVSLLALILKSIGTVPITYILVGMLADTLDHIEYVNGFRCDGFSTSIQSVILTIATGLSAGLFNLALGSVGYIAPVGTSEQIAQIVQPQGAQNLFAWGVFLIPAIGFLICFLLLSRYKLDKELPKMQEEIAARHS